MESVCRTCLSSDALRPLFPVKSKYHTFQRALFLCTGLQIKMDDGLSQMICRGCAVFIKSAIRFRNKSRASEMKLKQGLKFQEKYYKEENVNSKSSPTEACLEDEGAIVILIPPPKIEVIEPLTEQNNSESSADGDHFNSVSSTNDDRMFKKEQVEIEICAEPIKNKKKESIKKLKIQTEAAKNSVSDSFMDFVEASNDPQNPRQCKICKKKMKTRGGIRSHVIRHSLGYKFLCELCGSSHASIAQVTRHQQAMHGFARGDRFPCSYCDYRAIDPEMLEVHERHIHTKERPFVCDDCGEAFYSKRVLKQHFLIHTTDRPFQCDICQHTFKSKSRLTGHTVKTHRGLKYKYICPYCPKTYFKIYGCRKHIVKVHGIPKDQQGKIPRIMKDQGSNDISFNEKN